MSIVLYLRNLRHTFAAADEPPHAEKIENTHPQPVPHAVIGDTGAARTIDHIDVVDRKALAAHQCRQKAVQAVEIGQRQEEIASERLKAAAGIAGPVAQHGAANAIGDARLESLKT